MVLQSVYNKQHFAKRKVQHETNLFVGVKVKELSMGGSTSSSEFSDSEEMTMGMDKSPPT